MEGFKVFGPNWTCRGFQYAVGQVFEEDVEPSCCNRGFHFCKEIERIASTIILLTLTTKLQGWLHSVTLMKNQTTASVALTRFKLWKKLVGKKFFDWSTLEREMQDFATAVITTAVTGTAVIGTAVIGTAVTGTAVIATAVTGTAVIATAVIGTAVIGTAVIGTAVITTAVTGTAVIGTAVIGTAVIGTAVIGTAVIGTKLLFQVDVSTQRNRRFQCSINLLIGH